MTCGVADAPERPVKRARTAESFAREAQTPEEITQLLVFDPAARDDILTHPTDRFETLEEIAQFLIPHAPEQHRVSTATAPSPPMRTHAELSD